MVIRSAAPWCSRPRSIIPRKVGGVALIAPLTHLQSDVPPEALKPARRCASPVMRRIVAWTFAVPSTILYGKAALAQVFSPDTVPADFGTRGGGLLGVRPKAFYAASSDMVAVRDDLDGMVARYSSLAMPIGILYGDRDTILDHRVQGEPMVGKVPGLTLEIVEGHGHMLPVAVPDRTAHFIVEMAARVAAEAGATPAA